MMVQWRDVICDYDFIVAHLPGVLNVLPNSLSLLFPPEEELEGVILAPRLQKTKTQPQAFHMTLCMDHLHLLLGYTATMIRLI
ncbi:hypothetical protein O0I10_012854 [Lichtheimia ornata]|uniref:Uncharacterized protein n=1 Tax=Lichtheimia ornata TaxID=688661 RepID=A0AAD7XSQ5_9FUNG|nr:uncharacterized protein O0I10_012854 [Lichtheimia ornata]KAJ8651578.1 hypothetical protein O0I10_012854 [Lichtheimia ornata]